MTDPADSLTMLLRLSRVSFWLAAAVAALALIAPRGFETLLMGLLLAACTLAFGLWRSALHAQQRNHVAQALVPDAPLLDQASLHDAAAMLVRRAREAATYEAALHAVAQVLRGELGALEVTVHEVLELDATHARLVDLIAAQPGFRTVARRVRLDAASLGKALRQQREAGAPPGAVAVPVVLDGRVVAALELTGIGLAIEPKALAGLLELARVTLSRRAAAPVEARRRAIPMDQGDGRDRPSPAAEPPAAPSPAPIGGALAQSAHAEVQVVEHNGVRPDETTRALRHPGHRDTVASVMLESLPGDEDRFCRLGCDDHLSKPLCQGCMIGMLPERPHTDAGSGHSAGPGRVDAVPGAASSAAAPGDASLPVLDPVALGRLAELDPTGVNRLLERVLQAFQASAARLWPQAEVARTSGDQITLRLVAHTLKSSSASIGAMRLSQLCGEIETAIRLEAVDDLDAMIDAMSAALDTVLRAIARMLEERA